MVEDPALPTGARIGVPDHGISAAINSAGLEISQETPKDKGRTFIEKYLIISSLFEKHFKPTSVDKDFISIQSYVGFISEAQAYKKMLSFPSEILTDISKETGMPPSYQSLDFTFSAGSRRLSVSIKPFSFTSRSTRKFIPEMSATSYDRKNAERRNKKVSRFPAVEQKPYGVLLETVFRENEPPNDNIQDLFAVAQKHDTFFKKYFGEKIK